MKYTQINLQAGERRIIASKVSNMANWREATEADIVEVELQRLDPLKEAKIAELMDYDKSSAVNIFYFNNMPMWLPLEQRNNLINNSIPACEKAGVKTIYLSLGDIAMEMPIEIVKQMIWQIEYYAKQCFDVTDKHRRAILLLESEGEIEEYDFTVGYPKKVMLKL